MTWASEVWTRWYEAARESNQSSPASLEREDAEKWKAYEVLLERELESAREEYRHPWRFNRLNKNQCAPAEHVE